VCVDVCLISETQPARFLRAFFYLVMEDLGF